LNKKARSDGQGRDQERTNVYPEREGKRLKSGEKGSFGSFEKGEDKVLLRIRKKTSLNKKSTTKVQVLKSNKSIVQETGRTQNLMEGCTPDSTGVKRHQHSLGCGGNEMK